MATSMHPASLCTWTYLLVSLLALAPVCAAAPLEVGAARVEANEDRAALVVGFPGTPTVQLGSRAASRWVYLDFTDARLPAGARVFPSPSSLVEAANLEQVSEHTVRAAVRVARDTHVTVYRAPNDPAPGSTYTILVVQDALGGGKLPVQGRLSSRYGWRMHPILNEVRMHEGIDIAVPAGTPIRALADGEVTWADWRGNAGLCVIVLHAGDVESKYMHCSKLLVQKGDHVRRRQVLAKVGETGMTTGPHVHFAVSKGGHPIDPLRFLEVGPPAPQSKK